ncbi:MAG: hypothetical protein FWF60_05940 [Oscillospiraceae bacterium]|nr:hypothetical protein [Oscillospiraceae bacterium]
MEEIVWFFLPVMPFAIGLFSVLVLGRFHEKAAKIVYYIAFGLSVILLLYGLWANLWIAAWNPEPPALNIVRLLHIGELLVMAAQAVFLGIYFKKVKARRIIALTLMSTPNTFVLLIFLVGDLLGVYIASD